MTQQTSGSPGGGHQIGGAHPSVAELPEEPQCRFGYPQDQLERLLGDRWDAFNAWFSGQTGVLCDGQRWNPMMQAYEPTGCGPHGAVVYSHDLRRFLTKRR